MTRFRGWAFGVFPTVLVLAGFGCTEALSAQSVLRWDDFEQCDPCELSFTPFLAFGEFEGPGMIESEWARVLATDGRGYLVFGQGLDTGHRVARFSDGGRFLGSIGRHGDGPGEIRTIADVAFLGEDQILVLDGQRRRWITFRESGEVAAEAPLLNVRPGRFRVVEGDTAAVIGVIGRQPESARYPLHLAVLRSGSAVTHFGARSPSWTATDPSRSSVVLGEQGGRARSVWWSYSGMPHVEEWSPDGSPLRIITGNLDSFPVTATVARQGGRVSPPPVRMLAFAVDEGDRLWMLTLAPGGRWRTVTPRGPEGAVPEDQLSTLFSTRLDVFDLSDRRHLGFKVWDSLNVTLVEREGSVLISLVEYMRPDWPQVVLYRVGVGHTP